MASVFDVAKYILASTGEITVMKLQKLVYYSQVWSLVWDEEPLFENRIEAWANGPVSPSLYERHRGRFRIDSDSFGRGDPKALSGEQIDTIDTVLEFYGDKSAQWLSDLTHRERPWQDARGDLEPTERSNAEISLASIHEYYSGL